MKNPLLSLTTAGVASLLLFTGCLHRTATRSGSSTPPASEAERAFADQLVEEVRSRNAEIIALNERIARLTQRIADTQEQLLAALRQPAPAGSGPIDPAPDIKPGMQVGWEEFQREAASVAVLKMLPQPLVTGKGKPAWKRIPEQLAGKKFNIHTPVESVDGVAEYVVTAPGYLLVACYYEKGRGAADGVWTREQAHAEGWREATAQELGGSLVKSDRRQQVVFVKRVAAGETGRLRCNKSDPPFFITLAPTDEAGALAVVR